MDHGNKPFVQGSYNIVVATVRKRHSKYQECIQVSMAVNFYAGQNIS